MFSWGPLCRNHVSGELWVSGAGLAPLHTLHPLISEGCQDTVQTLSILPPAATWGFAALPGESPVLPSGCHPTGPVLLGRFRTLMGEALPRGRRLGWRSSHHCLCSAKCASRLPAKRASVLPARLLLADALPPWLSCWAPSSCPCSSPAPGPGPAPRVHPLGTKRGAWPEPGAGPCTQWVHNKHGPMQMEVSVSV